MLNSAPNINRTRIIPPITPPNPVFVKSGKPVTTGEVIKFEKRIVHGFSEDEISDIMSNLNTNVEETLFERINFYLFNNEALPPYGQNIILPDIETIKTFDLKKLQLAAIASIGVLAFASTNPSYAETSSGKKNIQTAQRIIDIIDPITYLSHRKAPNAAVNPDVRFSTYDQNLLTLNLYEESRGEIREGQLAVLLTVLERQLNSKHPASVPGVILKAYQYSWANKLEELYKEKRIDQKSLDTLKTLVNSFTSDKIENSVQSIRDLLAFVYKREIPKGLVSYHRFGMMKKDDYKIKASKNTILNVETIEAMYEESIRTSKAHPEIILIGNHLFYTQKILDHVSKLRQGKK